MHTFLSPIIYWFVDRWNKEIKEMGNNWTSSSTHCGKILSDYLNIWSWPTKHSSQDKKESGFSQILDLLTRKAVTKWLQLLWFTWDEKLANGLISSDDRRSSLVTKLGYRLVNATILDCPPYIWAPARYMCVPRLKPSATSIRTASSGVNGHLPKALKAAAEGILQYYSITKPGCHRSNIHSS